MVRSLVLWGEFAIVKVMVYCAEHYRDCASADPISSSSDDCLELGHVLSRETKAKYLRLCSSCVQRAPCRVSTIELSCVLDGNCDPVSMQKAVEL